MGWSAKFGTLRADGYLYISVSGGAGAIWLGSDRLRIYKCKRRGRSHLAQVGSAMYI